MKHETVYLTFKTDRVTSELLKMIAKSMKISQPELIEIICKDFIEELDEIAKEKLIKEGIIVETP